MLRGAALARAAGLQVFDLAALVLAFPAAYYAYYAYAYVDTPGEAWLAPMDAYWPAPVLAVVLWAASSWIYRVYESPVGRSGWAEVARAARALAVVAIVLAAVAFAARQHSVPRLLAGLYVALSLGLIVGARIVLRAIARVWQRGRNARRYAIVGTGGMAREIVETISAHPEWGLSFVGFIPLDGLSDRTRGPSLGPLSRLGKILEEEVLDVVVFAAPRDHLGDIERGVRLCEEQGIEVRISLDLLRFGPGSMAIADLDGVPMLAFTRTPSDTLALAAKRLFDVLVSACVLVALSPALFAVAVAIKLDSPGPVFFRQWRVGRNGRPFRMLKFRSMHRDAERRLEALRARNEMSGPVFKMSNDPRVTRVGRFLRRTSLDEFPQFWNVLLGEMSVVGPRPPIPDEVRQYKRWQRRRLSVRPGITCIWQISGRNDIDFDRWMELDLEYIDTWSLWGDIAICLKTIPAVLSARGAH